MDGALASLDELIAAETKKLELLKQYRQGLIQKFAKMRAAPPTQNEAVKEIIDFVLEAERKSCGTCERQFGVHDPNASHGNCKRHTIDSYKQIIELNPNNKDRIEPLIKKVMAMPDENFPPDLSLPQNQALLQSLAKKDYATHDRETQDYMDNFHRSRGDEPVPRGSSVQQQHASLPNS